MYGAGTETTINTLMWTILFLASKEMKHLQEKIQSDIDTECGDQYPTMQHKLSLLRATILGIFVQSIVQLTKVKYLC